MSDAEIHLYVHPQLKTLVSMVAQKEDKSVSKYISALIRADLSERGLLTPALMERLLA